jgi:hypothetical protein
MREALSTKRFALPRKHAGARDADLRTEEAKKARRNGVFCAAAPVAGPGALVYLRR